jgi:uncharacterized membrane protein YfcA
MWILILTFICSFVAFSLSALSGGGAGLLLIPMLGTILPLSQVPAALSIGTFSSSASRIFVFYKSIRFDIVKWFVPAALPAVLLGAFLLQFINPDYLQIAIGLFLLSHLRFIFFKNKEVENPKKYSNRFLIVIGFLAGFLSSLLGAVGLLFNRFYYRYGLSNEEIIATRAANEIILHVCKIILYIQFGLITQNVLLLGLTLAVAALLSTYSMKWILPGLKKGFLKHAGYLVMTVSGLVMFTQASETIMKAENVYISFHTVSKYEEAPSQWQEANVLFMLEPLKGFKKGLKFERTIDIMDLPAKEQHKFLSKSKKSDADKIIIRAVWRLGKHYYNGYLLKQNILIKKISLD